MYIKRIALIIVFQSIGYPLIKGKVGSLDFSTNLTTIYDSNLFGLSKEEFNKNKSKNSDLKSTDDVIITLHPILHYSKDFSLLSVSASSGVRISEHLFNKSRSNLTPVTTFNLDFDESLQKRFSTNSKIRFSASFDLGQSVGTDLIEGDLVSYTFFNIGLNARYNHSAKLAFGTGTSYEVREYQSGAVNNDYQDLETLPISSDVIYIYSQKLDFFLNHTYQKTETSNSTLSLGNTISHSFSLGTNGEISPKLTGSASVGYSNLSYQNNLMNDRSSFVTTANINLQHNSKTTSIVNLSRSFSPTASANSQLSTFLRYGINHSLHSTLRSNIGLSHSLSEVYMMNGFSFETTQTGLDASLTKLLSKNFTSQFSYNVNSISRNASDFNRHIISASITGRF
jgi:hypothetical protein